MDGLDVAEVGVAAVAEVGVAFGLGDTCRPDRLLRAWSNAAMSSLVGGVGGITILGGVAVAVREGAIMDGSPNVLPPGREGTRECDRVRIKPPTPGGLLADLMSDENGLGGSLDAVA